jgi:hypothetical protein
MSFSFKRIWSTVDFTRLTNSFQFKRLPCICCGHNFHSTYLSFINSELFSLLYCFTLFKSLMKCYWTIVGGGSPYLAESPRYVNHTDWDMVDKSRTPFVEHWYGTGLYEISLLSAGYNFCQHMISLLKSILRNPITVSTSRDIRHQIYPWICSSLGSSVYVRI